MNCLRALLYALLTVRRTLCVDWKIHVITMFTIAVMFVLLGSGFIFFNNVRLRILSLEQQSHVSVYFKEGATQTSIDSIQSKYCTEPFVKACAFRSAQAARELFLQQYGAMTGVVSSLEQNPFPASLELDLSFDKIDPEGVAGFINRLKRSPDVEFADEGEEWIVRWFKLLRMFNVLTALIGLGLLMATIFIVSNSIALMVYARRDEIEILQLVGTTDSMIRFPMMVEGAVMGAGGVVLALLSMKLAVFYGQSWILQQLQDVLAGHIVFLSAPLQLSFAMAGVVLGALGSYLSVNRFLKI